MTAKLKQKKITPEEYLELEEKAEYKSEYWDGIMIPLHGEPPELVGANINHIQIVSNLTALLSPLLRKRDCRVFPSEMKIWIAKRGKFFYPDVAIVCGKPQFVKNRRDVVENPLLLIEVLSDSTEVKDRAEKFWSYQTLESFQEYVLVSQNRAVVEQFTRQTDGSWRYLAAIGLESVITSQTIEAVLQLQDIYDLVEFEVEEL
jgi:Uma2 family endonuclease